MAITMMVFPLANPRPALAQSWPLLAHEYFFPYQRWSGMANGNKILGMVRLAALALFPEFFKLTKLARCNPLAIGITQDLIFSKIPPHYPSETCR